MPFSCNAPVTQPCLRLLLAHILHHAMRATHCGVTYAVAVVDKWCNMVLDTGSDPAHLDGSFSDSAVVHISYFFVKASKLLHKKLNQL